jgi:hypothetical protein
VPVTVTCDLVFGFLLHNDVHDVHFVYDVYDVYDDVCDVYDDDVYDVCDADADDVYDIDDDDKCKTYFCYKMVINIKTIYGGLNSHHICLLFINYN